jgi:hypothetical protein
VGSVGAAALAQRLAHVSALTHLELAGCDLAGKRDEPDASGASALTRALPCLKCLQRFRLQETEMPRPLFKAFGQAMRQLGLPKSEISTCNAARCKLLVGSWT